uniref:Glutamate rich 3 n=1 Tax=Molossus molossus TaxID=27622 RepID=A0A7J8F7R1_MOLMO|nr:glutamate rich 3 [Molossus molossus]
MSQSHPSGLLAAYNSLTDKHLAGYFNNTRIRQHLLRSGLITRSGRILSEKEYKLNIMKKDHQKYIRQCLAQAIFHKVLDMERYHQLEIKKKLETLARKERIQRFKGEPIRWPMEKGKPVLNPHPPVGPKTNRGRGVLVAEGHSSPITLTAPRPYTAPGIMQPPIRLQPLPSNPATGTVPKVTPGSRSKTSPLENAAPFPTGGKKAMMRFRSSMDNSHGGNQYRLLNANNYMMPIPPPPPPPNGKITRENRSETWRRRRFRPTTAPNGLEPVFARDSRRINKTPLHSNAIITMIYLGKTVHLSYNHPNFTDEVKVYQQHCGGENLCVYKGNLLEKETFQFISKRHHGFPFSLTFYLNGMQVNRLSSCCEYKHRKSSRLGGKRGYFGFVCVERSSPCYKCIIATGLDKKTASPELRKQKSLEKREELKKGEGKLRKDRAYMIPRRNEMEGSRTSASVLYSAEELKTGVEEVRTALEEMERKETYHVWEDDQENIFKYEYEEDFEVDEEKQGEKVNKEGQADDQINAMSKSPSDSEKNNLDPGNRSRRSSRKVPGAGDGVTDEDDGRSESDVDEDKQDIKTTSSSSSRSHPYSSCSEDDSAPRDREVCAENKSVRSSSSQEFSENDELGNPHFPAEDSLKIEIEDQKIIKVDVETKPLRREKSLENVLEEETKKGTQVITEGLSEKSWEQVSKEEEENYRSKLRKESTAKVKDKRAGLFRVEKGAPDRKSVVEESTAPNSDRESTPAASEMDTPEKEEAEEEDGVPQRRDADPVEALWGRAGVTEFPWRARKPAALFTEGGESPGGPASRAEAGAGTGAGAGGDRELDEGGLTPVGKEAAGASGGLHGEGAPEPQAWTQTELEAGAAWGGGRGSGTAVFAGRAAAPSSGCVQEAAALPEAAVLEQGEPQGGLAVSEAGSAKPDVEDREGGASTDVAGAEEDTALEREDGPGEAMLGGQDPAKARKAATAPGTPLSPPSPERAEMPRASEEGLEGPGEKEEQRKEVEAEVESKREDDREETPPEESDLEREGREAERPNTPPGATAAQGQEVARARAGQGEATEEEQKFRGEAGGTVKAGRPEEETPGPPHETECEVGKEAPTEAPGWTEATGPRGAEPPREPGGAVLEPSRGRTGAVAGEGGGVRGAADTGPQGPAGPPCGENGEPAAPSERGEGPGPQGEAVPPGSDPAGQERAAEVPGTAPGQAQAQAPAAQGQDVPAGLESRGKEGSLQERPGMGADTMTLEDMSEGGPVRAGTWSEAAGAEAPEGQGGEERAPGHRPLQGEAAVAQGGLRGGAVADTAPEATAVLPEAKTVEGEAEAKAAASSSDAAGQSAGLRAELPGEAAAAEQEAEEMALSRGEGVVTGASEWGGPGGPSDLDQKGGEADASPRAELTGEEAGVGCPGGGPDSGEAEEFRLGLTQETESEQSRKSLQDAEILPVNADCPGTQEKQEYTLQRKSENADVSLNHKKA